MKRLLLGISLLTSFSVFARTGTLTVATDVLVQALRADSVVVGEKIITKALGPQVSATAAAPLLGMFRAMFASVDGDAAQIQAVVDAAKKHNLTGDEVLGFNSQLKQGTIFSVANLENSNAFKTALAQRSAGQTVVAGTPPGPRAQVEITQAALVTESDFVAVGKNSPYGAQFKACAQDGACKSTLEALGRAEASDALACKGLDKDGLSACSALQAKVKHAYMNGFYLDALKNKLIDARKGMRLYVGVMTDYLGGAKFGLTFSQVGNGLVNVIQKGWRNASSQLQACFTGDAEDVRHYIPVPAGV